MGVEPSIGGRTGTRRWRPTPAFAASTLVHAGGVLLLAANPASWALVLAALLGNHVLLLTAVLCPRGRVLGPNLVRLPQSAVRRREVALTFDDGPDPEVTPLVLDMLDRHGAKASFFVVGEKARKFPEIVAEMVRRGHSVENHSHRHSRVFALYGIGSLARDVLEAQATLTRITGKPPRFFRAPMGFRSPFLDPVLARSGLEYVSWTRRGFDAIQRDPADMLMRLTKGLAAGDVLLLHDGAPARTGAGVPLVLAVLPRLLEQLAAQDLHSVALPAACSDGPVD